MSRKTKGFLLILPFVLCVLAAVVYYTVESYRMSGFVGLLPALSIIISLSAVVGVYYLMSSD